MAAVEVAEPAHLEPEAQVEPEVSAEEVEVEVELVPAPVASAVQVETASSRSPHISKITWLLHHHSSRRESPDNDLKASSSIRTMLMPPL